MSNENTEQDENENIISCYICGLDLMKEYRKDTTQQNDLKESVQKFPTMIRYDGQKKELCASCYKNHLSGMAIYQENNPNWKPPKARE